MLQRELAAGVVLCPAPVPRRIVGLDCAFHGATIFAVAVVWDTLEGALVETRACSGAVTFPYVPGLLSFREIPVLLRLLARIRSTIDGVLCDGQGIAHPRRLGLAAHLGLLIGKPTVGCAKSRLCGTFVEPGPSRGDWSPLEDGTPGANGQMVRIGTVLRTRAHTRPLFVSPGHLVDHASSVEWVLACGGGFRLPEPTRLADRLVGEFRRQGRFRGGVIARATAPAARSIGAR